MTDRKLTGVATVFSSGSEPRRDHNKECLQESGVFEDGEVSYGANDEVTCSVLAKDAIAFYEARLSQLQDKLDIYETCGEERERLLQKRMEKELFLAYEVRRLNQQLTCLSRRNRRLEEERCEFEEAENDSRLECQR